MTRTSKWYSPSARERLAFQAVMNAGIGAPEEITADYTLSYGDAGFLVEVNSATAVTITVSDSVFQPGQRVDIAQIGAGQVTLAAAAGLTLHTPATLKTNGQWTQLNVRFKDTHTGILSGNISAT